MKPNRYNIVLIELTALMVKERIKSSYKKVKVLLKTVFGVARYGVSKAEFSNYEDTKTSLSR
jgi:hypothetical protein